jgi:pimeloyl-ACP methyl ester carboxylesterase
MSLAPARLISQSKHPCLYQRILRHIVPACVRSLRRDKGGPVHARRTLERLGLSGNVYTGGVFYVRSLAVLLILASFAHTQRHVSFSTQDGGLIYADLYGSGSRGIVLAHGGRFNKESWKPQAEAIAAAGFHVLAFDFRGYGQSRGPGQSDIYTAPLQLDVLAAVHYLHTNGAKTVSVVGGSMGGGAAADATVVAGPGEIDRIVELGGAAWKFPPEKIKGRKLIIVARDDASEDGPRLPKIQSDYEKMPEPKQLIILAGSAHAQFLFQTDQGERVMQEILRFLSQP